jgi:hypothetical protein
MRRIVIAGLAVFASVLASPAIQADAATPAAASSGKLVSLSEVSCVSADFCMAVGTRETQPGDNTTPAAMIWNGERWRDTGVSRLKGTTDSWLESVSCASVSYCEAVGIYDGAEDFTYPFAETWNGKAWTAAALPRLGPHVGGDRVSCAAVRRCLVGFASNPMPKTGQLFADSLTGATWTLHALNPPKGSGWAAFVGVSCLSATHCVLLADVEGPRTTELFVTWNGRAFTAMKTVAPFPALFEGLSCASAKDCLAVGTWFTGPRDLGYFALWNGSTWRGARVPQLKAAVVLSPLDVSCPAPGTCVMVGYQRLPAGGYPNTPVAESYNGKSWTRMSVPVLAGYSGADLNAVSCLSATRCVTVGVAYRGERTISTKPFTGFWNGKSWKLVTAS